MKCKCISKDIGYHRDDCPEFTSHGKPKFEIDPLTMNTYVEASLYYAYIGNLEAARKAAHWPGAEIKDFTKENLIKRFSLIKDSIKKEHEKYRVNFKN